MSGIGAEAFSSAQATDAYPPLPPKRSPQSHPKYRILHEDAFATVTEESAYWVGFLMADGSVSPPHNNAPNGAPHLSLSIAEIDAAHMEKFRAFLGCENPVYRRPPGRRSKQWTLTLHLSSFRIVTDLAAFGIHPRKTYGASVVGLEGNRHFWRGIVDGDGSLGLYRRSDGRHHGMRPSLGIVGPPALIEQFRAFVSTIIPGCGYRPRHHALSPYVHVLDLKDRTAKEVVHVLYGNSTVSLDRKAGMAERILTAIPGRTGRPPATTPH
jgi:hypothetical protein